MSVVSDEYRLLIKRSCNITQLREKKLFCVRFQFGRLGYSKATKQNKRNKKVSILLALFHFDGFHVLIKMRRL